MNRVLKFIKKNISSFICFLMAIIVALTATLSYARYVTDGKFNGASSIGSFSSTGSSVFMTDFITGVLFATGLTGCCGFTMLTVGFGAV